MAAPGNYFILVAENAITVCADEALLATALLTVGVAEHPEFPFSITCEESPAPHDDRVRWIWCFKTVSTCGIYKTDDLLKWWRDPAWLAANPKHEWAIVLTALRNMAEVARRIRDTQPRIVIRRGQLVAYIPARASAARREHLLAQLEGRVPIGALFTDPTEPSSSV